MISMRTIPLSLTILLAAAPLLSAQGPELPSVLRAGLLAYEHGGASAALRAWSQDSPIADKFDSDLEHVFVQVENIYGRMIGYDVLSVVALSPHSSRSYVVILYESGPAYIWFDCYKKADHWVLTGFLYNVKPDAILPPAMLAH
jgi:hypothetical protein